MDKVQSFQQQDQQTIINHTHQNCIETANDSSVFIQRQEMGQNILQQTRNYKIDLSQQKQPKKLKDENQKHSKYRPDIDGLRAIAITLVLIFHAWPNSLTGGFIGVDVFFVISGYLITSIICKEAHQNKFSYLQFYSRRIKRIYPALTLVLIFTFIMGINYLQQRNLQIMSKTMAASTLFSANLEILTYQQGYFDPQVKTNPLLHLWSLGVQQQFYIVWPLFITIIVKFRQTKSTIIAMGIFMAFSFFFNILTVQEYTKFDFYFPLCRFWQMAVGGFIAYLNMEIKEKLISNILSIISCLVILYSSFSLSQDSLFPGYWALAPIISSGFIILTKNSYINENILSHQVVVFVGKISYPLYLWHWPLLVFSRILYPKGSDQIFSQISFILILSVVFSILTYYYVQNKLRFSKKHMVVFGLLGVMFLIGLTSFYTYKYPQRVSFQSQLSEINDQNFIQDKQEGLQQVQTVQKNIELINKQVQRLQKNDQSNKQQQQMQENKQQLAKQNEKISQKIIAQDNKNQELKNKYFEKIGFDYIKKFQNLMIPGPDDYVTINQTKLPNASKNKKRKKPNKLKIQIMKNLISKINDKGPLQIQPINKKSKYYQENIPFKLGQRKGYFNVINQGRQNQLFIIGDSYSQMIGWRFRKLYEQHLRSNTLDQFPTILHVVQRGNRFYHCSQHYDFVINLIKKHKPKRIFMCYNWLAQFYNRNPKAKQRQIQHTKSSCQYQTQKLLTLKDISQNLKISMKVLKQFMDMGIQVYSTAITPMGSSFNPSYMTSKNSVIESNIRALKLSQFKYRHKNGIKVIEKSLKKNGIKVIDFTPNHCWNDICQVALPSGFPIFTDGAHYSFPFVFYWVSAVDFLVKF